MQAQCERAAARGDRRNGQRRDRDRKVWFGDDEKRRAARGRMRRLGRRRKRARARQRHHLSDAASRLLRDRRALRRAAHAAHRALPAAQAALARAAHARGPQPRQRGAAPANLRGVRMLYKALAARRSGRACCPTRRRRSAKARGRISSDGPAYTMTLVTRLQKQTGAAVSSPSPSACRAGAATGCISRSYPRRDSTSARSTARSKRWCAAARSNTCGATTATRCRPARRRQNGGRRRAEGGSMIARRTRRSSGCCIFCRWRAGAAWARRWDCCFMSCAGERRQVALTNLASVLSGSIR